MKPQLPIADKKCFKFVHGAMPILACKSKAGAVCAVANCVPNCKVIKKGGAGESSRTFTGGQRADFAKFSPFTLS
jgi:hypothetical protein